MRLGGPNFHEIPINRPIAPVHNNQRDGHMRQTINKSRAAYEPNTLGGGCPFQAGADMGGFVPTRKDSPARRFASEARSSSITSARHVCFTTARQRPRKTTSSARFALSWARLKSRTFGNGW